jgi:hypothetical protein
VLNVSTPFNDETGSPSSSKTKGKICFPSNESDGSGAGQGMTIAASQQAAGDVLQNKVLH